LFLFRGWTWRYLHLDTPFCPAYIFRYREADTNHVLMETSELTAKNRIEETLKVPDRDPLANTPSQNSSAFLEYPIFDGEEHFNFGKKENPKLQAEREVWKMTMPRKDGIEKEVVEGWRVFVDNLGKGLDMLEEDIDEAAGMADACTSEWCQATEHVIDELSNSLFSISEPSWSSAEDSRKIKALRRKLHDLYAKYKTVSKS